MFSFSELIHSSLNLTTSRSTELIKFMLCIHNAAIPFAGVKTNFLAQYRQWRGSQG